MSEEHPTRRRDLMKPAQLLGLSAAAAVFAFVVTLISMGFFQRRFADQAKDAFVVAIVVAGITFIATAVVIALLLLMVQPAEISKTIDEPVLVPEEEIEARKAAEREAKQAHHHHGADATPHGSTSGAGGTAEASGGEARDAGDAGGADGETGAAGEASGGDAGAAGGDLPR